MIDQATIDRILDAAQIVDIVSDFVTLRKRGVNYVGLCPFHDDKTPSFYVSPSKGLCKCFSCGKGGNAVHFIMEHEQMSYPEALKYLAKKYGIEIKERELSSEEKLMQSERESLFIVNNFARDYFQNILKNHVDGRSIGMAYFRNRGFRDDIIEKFQLGYCTESHDAMAQEAIKMDSRKNILSRQGFVTKRTITACVTAFGDVLFFQCTHFPVRWSLSAGACLAVRRRESKLNMSILPNRKSIIRVVSCMAFILPNRLL